MVLDRSKRLTVARDDQAHEGGHQSRPAILVLAVDPRVFFSGQRFGETGFVVESSLVPVRRLSGKFESGVDVAIPRRPRLSFGELGTTGALPRVHLP